MWVSGSDLDPLYLPVILQISSTYIMFGLLNKPLDSSKCTSDEPSLLEITSIYY